MSERTLIIIADVEKTELSEWDLPFYMFPIQIIPLITSYKYISILYTDTGVSFSTAKTVTANAVTVKQLTVNVFASYFIIALFLQSYNTKCYLDTGYIEKYFGD